jgi:DNA processing protein
LIRTVRRRGADYPPLLGAIHDPPAMLHVRGDADPAVLRRTAVGIVGARSCSSYGRTVARTLARELAAAGVLIVSGMARGVDAEAHRGALDAGGITVAVLGCGIDRDYPASHAELARRVCERGLIVSEYAPGVPPAPWRFPARNRIIAGLSKVVVVIEARERSGALITADFALEEGREVMVVPGEITSALSAGTNALLRLGAAPVLGVADVAAALGIELRPAARGDLGADAKAVLAAVSAGATASDELARVTKLGAARVAAALSELELAQAVRIEEGVVRSSIDL